MDSPTSAECSNRTCGLEPDRAALAAFVAESRRTRPLGWALVERLKRTCRQERPLTAAGYKRSAEVFHDARGT